MRAKAIYARQWVHHRAKAFGGFLATAITSAVLTAIEQTFDFQLGEETKAMIVSFVVAQAVYWISNGPKEGTA